MACRTVRELVLPDIFGRPVSEKLEAGLLSVWPSFTNVTALSVSGHLPSLSADMLKHFPQLREFSWCCDLAAGYSFSVHSFSLALRKYCRQLRVLHLNASSQKQMLANLVDECMYPISLPITGLESCSLFPCHELNALDGCILTPDQDRAFALGQAGLDALCRNVRLREVDVCISNVCAPDFVTSLARLSKLEHLVLYVSDWKQLIAPVDVLAFEACSRAWANVV